MNQVTILVHVFFMLKNLEKTAKILRGLFEKYQIKNKEIKQ
jgi:hypothetical protein